MWGCSYTICWLGWLVYSLRAIGGHFFCVGHFYYVSRRLIFLFICSIVKRGRTCLSMRGVMPWLFHLWYCQDSGPCPRLIFWGCCHVHVSWIKKYYILENWVCLFFLELCCWREQWIICKTGMHSNLLQHRAPFFFIRSCCGTHVHCSHNYFNKHIYIHTLWCQKGMHSSAYMLHVQSLVDARTEKNLSWATSCLHSTPSDCASPDALLFQGNSYQVHVIIHGIVNLRSQFYECIQRCHTITV